MLPKNFNEPMGAPAIFEKQIEIKLLPPASTLQSRIQVSVISFTDLAHSVDEVVIKIAFCFGYGYQRC
ncbi:MAG: hypothetical protein P8X74_17870 [Reinekea sp.]